MQYLRDAYQLSRGLPCHLIARMRGVTPETVRENRARYERVTGEKLPRFKAGRPRKIDPNQFLIRFT